MIKSNVTRNEMKTAHKINKEGGKKKKKGQLKSTHTQTTNRTNKKEKQIQQSQRRESNK